MKKFAFLIIAAAICTGCVLMQGSPVYPASRKPGSQALAQAVKMLEKRDTSGAAKVLKALSIAKSEPGVTDEALFRLALLSLSPAPDRPVSRRAQLLLKRLKNEYPASPWTVQAAQLMELVRVSEELRHQSRRLRELKADNEELSRSNKEVKENNEALNRNLKEMKATNDELKKEISELSRNIEQLKNLDLELERKTR